MNAILFSVLLSLGTTPPPGPSSERAPADQEAIRAIVKANSAFALDLYQKLSREEGNLVYSPWSISTVLAMTSVGAQGRTLDEMNRVLHLPDPRLTHLGVSKLLSQMKQQRGYELNAANAVFARAGIPWRKDFLEYTRYYYGSSIFAPDFAKQPDASREMINRWVEGQTRQRIRGLLVPGTINSDTAMVLVNAVYFKGAWDKPFKKRDTMPRPFWRSAKEKIETPTMLQSDSFYYGENKAVQMLGMPYKGQDLMMVFILPRERNELAKLEKELTGDLVQEWISRLAFHPQVDVFMPRFKMTHQFRLKETLADMGIRDLFDRNCNLSGMVSNYPLFVDSVVHKAFLELQEEGTEAAAATAATMTFATAPPSFTPPPPRPVFRADHPFLFSIVDRRSGSMLFVGRMSDPTK